MPGQRTYGDPCGVARALDVVGERWALLVVRELLLGPKRFADLSRGLGGMSQNVLSQRLRELEQAGVACRRRLEVGPRGPVEKSLGDDVAPPGPPTASRVYELTERGYALEPVLLALGQWGSRIPLASAAELSLDALVLALKSTFDPRAAAGLQARLELRLGHDRFHAEVRDGQFLIARGSAHQPDATLETDGPTLRSVVFGRRDIFGAVQSGRLCIDGNPDVAARFAACFPRPTPPT